MILRTLEDHIGEGGCNRGFRRMSALRRVAAPGGVGLHAVDFHDHLGGGLRHLRFSDAFWEGPAVARAGLYCNRLGLSQVMDAFAAAGFRADVAGRGLWPAPPQRGIPARLRRTPADDLVCHAAIEARPA